MRLSKVSSSLLPATHERVAFANILLWLGLSLLACFTCLWSLGGAEGANFLLAGSAALLIYAASAFGSLLAWRRLMQHEADRLRLASFSAACQRWAQSGDNTARAARDRPLATLWLAALAGVMVSCYPVVFVGQSFLAPNLVPELFYGHQPTVLNSPSDRYEYPAASDVGTMMWQHMPYSVSEGRALFHDHELPVWNRYTNGGTTLIGQGQAMLGDPLNWLVVLAGGASWAWDLKFLVARLLFAAGIGLCVRVATGRSRAACLLAFSACFFDYFAYRLNHPATFSLCYAPWVLLAWLRIVHGPNPAGLWGARAQLGRVALLLFASWMELNSGTAKESLILLVGLNGAGLLVLLLDDRRSWRWKGFALTGLAWAGVGFLLVSVSLWRTLLEALAHSWNNYSVPLAWQLQPGLFIGLFDDIFYRQFNAYERVLDPALNFVVLLGVACVVAFGGTLPRRGRVFLALSLAALGPLALVFGVVPPAWICAVPFLRNVTHVDNTFSCPLLVLLPVLAGFGFERALTLLTLPGFARRYLALVATPLLLIAVFLGTTHAMQRSDFSFLVPATGAIPLSDFFQGYVWSLVAALLGLPLLARWWAVAGSRAAWGAAPWVALGLGTLLWRGGVQTHAVVGENRCVEFLGPRVDLRVRSTAVDHLLAAARLEPGRYLGFNNTIMSGYTAVFGLESPSGPDALQSKAYRQLLGDSGAPLQDVWNLPVTRPLVASPLHRFYDLLNVRYYADEVLPGSPAPAPVPGLRTVGRYDLDLYESPTAWPRAFFTDTLVPARNVTDLIKVLTQGDGRPFAAVAPPELRARADLPAFAPLLHGPGDQANRRVVAATGYRLTSRTTSFHLQAPGPGLAVLMEAYQTPLQRPFLSGWSFGDAAAVGRGVHGRPRPGGG